MRKCSKKCVRIHAQNRHILTQSFTPSKYQFEYKIKYHSFVGKFRDQGICNKFTKIFYFYPFLFHCFRPYVFQVFFVSRFFLTFHSISLGQKSSVADFIVFSGLTSYTLSLIHFSVSMFFTLGNNNAHTQTHMNVTRASEKHVSEIQFQCGEYKTVHKHCYRDILCL